MNTNDMSYCAVCKKPFSGPMPALQHYESEGHKKKIRNIAIFKGEASDGLLPSGMDTFYCDKCHKTFHTKAVLDDHKSMCSMVGRPTTEPVVGVDRTRRYGCGVCGIWANSKEHLDNHLQGRLHKKKMREVSGAPVDATQWFECPVCNCKLNSKLQLEFHLRSHPTSSTTSSTEVTLATAAEALKKVKVDNKITYEQKCPDPSTEENNSAQAMNNLNITEDEKVTGEKISNCTSDDYLSIDCASSHYASCETSPAADKFPDEEHILQKASGRDDPDRTCVKEVWSPNSESPYHIDDSKKQSESFDDSDGLHLGDGIMSKTHHCQTGLTVRSGFFCNLCKVPLTGTKPKEQHENSDKHLKNLALHLKNREDKTFAEISKQCIVNVNSSGPRSPPNTGVKTEELDARRFPYSHSYCTVCRVPFTSEKNRLDHMKSQKHTLRVMHSECAPERCLPDIIKKDAKCDDFSYDLTTTVPRSYQCELFEKAMQTDTVCFLPTGTGKTLTGCMVMSYMLKLNPQRPVVFLVDKVLLVLQQSKYIEKELQNFEFERMDFETKQVTKRNLKIAALCGRQQDAGSHALPLWKHDVIVSTAAYFRNLLESGHVRWSDMSLVVFDEVHHCAKDHPFNILMKNHHLQLPAMSRPKILGLTASPAGKKTVDHTEVMLRELLSNLGDAHIAIVEEYKILLERHQSCAQLIIREVSLNDEESQLLSEFRKYLLSCYQYLERCIEFDDMEPANAPVVAEDDIQKFINNMKEALKQKKVRNDQTLDDDILWHVSAVCNACLSLGEYGIAAAYEELENLLDDENYGSFENVLKKGFECSELWRLTRENQTSKNINLDTTSSMATRNPSLYPAAKMLLAELHGQIDWKTQMNAEKPPIALVLVKERVTVKLLEATLKADSSLAQLGVQIASITGHGNGSDEGGMSVPKQKRILGEMKQHKYQVIVATSVAEEGLDLPECELVVEMDPPSTVTSLIQIRGRARKKGGRFVAICRRHGAKEKIDNLLMREKHMEEACKNITESQRRG